MFQFRNASHTSAESVQSEDTVYSADSIEFSPIQQDIFVCGTYQIQKVEGAVKAEGEQKEVTGDSSDEEEVALAPKTRRLGRALVYQVAEDGQSFNEIQRFDGPAVLDMKWSVEGAPGKHRLAIANAEGQVTIHSWDDEKRHLHLDQTTEVESSDILCLSLDWSNRLTPSQSDSMIVSCSNGNLSHLVTDDTGTLVVEQAWKAHDYEPWITAFDLWRPEVVWSGGDDLKLKQWDLRTPHFPTSINKNFEGGVTTIAPNPHVEHLVAVGSYDEHLRLFDARNIKQPLRKVPVGGGIWRTKWHPDIARKSDVLLACMHGGFNVVNFGESLTTIGAQDTWSYGLEEEDSTITTRFDKHESIAYGVDWSRQKIESLAGKSVVASCSFYDHLLHMWHA